MNIKINNDIELTKIWEIDRVSLAKYINDRVVYENIVTVPYPYHLEDADEFIESCRAFEQKNHARNNWAIRRKGEMIGGIGFLYTYGLDSHKDEIGYWLASEYRNKGIMTDVVTEFTKFAHKVRKLNRIQALVFTKNIPSYKVLSKCGYMKEGLLRNYIKRDGVYKDVIIMSHIDS